MEKFSKYRDPSTGIAPLVYPLPASTDSLPLVVSVIITPLAWLLGFVRTLLVVLLLLAHWLLVEVLMTVLLIIPPLHSILTRILTAILSRLMLFFLGLAWISNETVSLKRTARSPPSVPFTPHAGDVIIANSSSYIDVLYLAFRYNPYFLLPCSSTGSKASASSSSLITSYRCVSLTTALLSSGHLPERSERGETLDEITSKASRPVVWFPEATTSNNRALLKFAELVPPKAGVKSRALQVFTLSFKYPLPNRVLPSATYPIPSRPVPLLPHIFSITSTPFPTSLHIRQLHASESPPLSSSPKTTELESVAEALAGVGRWKRTRVDWELKAGFLEMRSNSNSKGTRKRQ